MELLDFTANARNSIAFGVVQGVVSGSIAAGELAVLTEAAQFRRANERLPLSALVNTTLGPSALFAPAEVENGALLSPGDPVRLAGGNIVFPGGSGASTAFIRTPAGTAVARVAFQGTSTSRSKPIAVPLSNGNFVLVGMSGQTLRGQIYTPSGETIGAELLLSNGNTIYNDNGFSRQYFGACALPSGGFAVSFALTATSNAMVRFYDNAGTLTQTFTAATLGPEYQSWGQALIPCANGDVIWHTHLDDGAVLSRVKPDGTRVWGPTRYSGQGNTGRLPGPASSASPTWLATPENMMVELTNGTIAVVLRGNNSEGPSVFLLNGSNGAFIRRVQLGTLATIDVMPALLKTPVGFAVVTASALTATNLSLYQNDGQALLSQATVETGQGDGTTHLVFSAAWVGAGIAINRHARSTNFSDLRFLMADLNGTKVGASSVYATAGNQLHTVSQGVLGGEDGIAYVPFYNAAYTGGLGFAAFKCARCALFGVAQSSGADGASIIFKALGHFALPASQVFPNSLAWDARANAVPGSRGIVGANRVALSGLV